jgi:hypothetical protein
MWDTFERRVTDSTAAAIRLAEELSNLPLQAAQERLVREMEGLDDAALGGFWRVLKLLDYQEKTGAQVSAERQATLAALLGALWPAEDETTRQIMTAFHGYLGDLAPDVALQLATIDFLRTADSETRNPLYWAPFFISAVGRAAPTS